MANGAATPSADRARPRPLSSRSFCVIPGPLSARRAEAVTTRFPSSSGRSGSTAERERPSWCSAIPHPAASCRCGSALTEAQAIALALHGVIMPRPMTHDLMASLISELRAEVEEVVVTDLRNNTYLGIVRLRVAGEQQDSRRRQPAERRARAGVANRRADSRGAQDSGDGSRVRVHRA